MAGKRFYEFDNFNAELSGKTDKNLMDEVVNGAEVSIFFDKDPVGMALLSNAKTKAFKAFHEITRAANPEDAAAIVRATWSELKFMETLVKYIDESINSADMARQEIDNRDNEEKE